MPMSGGRPPEKDSSTPGLELALKLALQRLGEADIPHQCRNAGAISEAKGGERAVILDYFTQSYRIALPEGEFSPDAPVRDRLLMLHYLLRANGTPPSGRLITFKELPGGQVYAPVFYARAVKPILSRFGSCAEELVAAGECLGGHRSELGDVSVTVPIFSRVQITINLWRGDAELPPEASFLFDANIQDYLETEDVTVLCQGLAARLTAASSDRYSDR